MEYLEYCQHRMGSTVLTSPNHLSDVLSIRKRERESDLLCATPLRHPPAANIYLPTNRMESLINNHTQSL